MLINSIFLSKTTPESTPLENKSIASKGFSYLFSNIIRILKPEESESIQVEPNKNIEPVNPPIPNSLVLMISLFSNNALPEADENIGKMLTGFFEPQKTETGLENAEDNTEITSTDYKVPKYFSTNSESFLTEIKNIIDRLSQLVCSGNSISEIRLITENKVINLKPNTIAFSELEKLITEQLKSNLGFGLLIKSGEKEIALDVEPVNSTKIDLTLPSIEKIDNNNKPESNLFDHRNSTSTFINVGNSDVDVSRHLSSLSLPNKFEVISAGNKHFRQ